LLACACNGFLGVVQLFVQTAMASTFAELMPADVRNLMAGEQSMIAVQPSVCSAACFKTKNRCVRVLSPEHLLIVA
jgi:hypothetical protein